MSDLRKYIYSKRPGDSVKLTVNRLYKNFEVEIILGTNIWDCVVKK